MLPSIEVLLAWINAHPGWAQVLLFSVALLDAVFIIGAFVPAGIVLFAIGALVALGTLELWPTVFNAAAGAIIGDCFSFWIGHHYGERMFEWRVLRKYPEAINNGRRFFARHGAKSVVLARFLGPMRAITPALAGAAGMRAWVFVVTDSCAALVWSFVYVVPGVVFGASLGLAAEVAGRLATLLLALVVLLWFGIWLTLFSMRQVQAHANRWIGGLLDWSRRHRRLGVFGAALADPDYPETPVLALLATVLLALGALSLFLLGSPVLHPYPMPIDAAAFQTLRDLHTPWGVSLAETLLQLGEWPVYAPVAGAAFAALLLGGSTRAAAHWIAALGFGALVSLGIYAIPTLPPPYEFFGLPEPSGFNPRDLVLATVTYACLPALVATGRPRPVRALLYTSSFTLLLLIVLARLYLGAQWYSMALFGLVIGVIWAALLALGYRRHQPERMRARTVLVPVIAVFVVAVGLRWNDDALQSQVPHQPAPLATLPAELWFEHGSQELPVQRYDMAGRPKQVFNLQWAGELPTIAAQLREAGWVDATRLHGVNPLRWLTASSAIEDLPLLPQVHAGTHQALNLRLPIDEHSQYLLRLWPSGFRLDDGAPLWIGSITRQSARNYYRLFRYPVADAGPVPLGQMLGVLGVRQVAGPPVYRLRS